MEQGRARLLKWRMLSDLGWNGGREGGGGCVYPRVVSSQRQRDHVSCYVPARSLAGLIAVRGLLIGANMSQQSD